jgi:hypothetical protein
VLNLCRSSLEFFPAEGDVESAHNFAYFESRGAVSASIAGGKWLELVFGVIAVLQNLI